MNRASSATIAAALAFALLAPAASGQSKDEQRKLAQTGMKFLSVSMDPRAAALSDAMTSMEGGATSLFYNPAAMAHQSVGLNLSVAQTQWITNIDYNMAAASFRPFGGRLGVLGVSVLAVSYPDMPITIRTGSEQGFEEIGTFSPAATSFGVGYAKAITDRFSVGGQVKMARQDLGQSPMSEDGAGGYVYQDNTANTLAYDFGVLYRTGLRSLNFAVSARNFASELRYAEESFELPLTLRIGLSMNLFEALGSMSDVHALRLTADAEHPRDYPEQIRLGGEYTFLNTFSLRAGYLTPADEQGLSLGLGVHQNLAGFGFGADYAYTDFGAFNDFGRVHRLALQLSIR